MIRILLVDDQDLLRAGIKALLSNDPDIRVVGEAGNGKEALRKAAELAPDVVLMDIRMPIMDGIEATRRILKEPENRANVLILTTFDDDTEVFNAIRAGACSYLLKDSPPDELRRAVKAAAEGVSLLSPQITRKLMDHAASGGQDESDVDLSSLTGREIEVMRGVGLGQNNLEIAAELFLSPATTRTYVSRILTKLGLRDRTELALLAHRARLYSDR
ncbi:response regulator [Nesterenkonia ebinurensis]|uniref:response regulator n=1 Tax=Nesterenkonia ebinurensis TaxID=2608252 RepID=UPI00123D7ADF|nr:response regulator transcription factor [Nesterenkonia ebinurensis]